MKNSVGEFVTLRPMHIKERFRFFKWATNSEATPYWYGQRTGDEVPSYIVFKLEWPDHYFTGEKPKKGQCFAIEESGKTIGQVNYNEIDPKSKSTNLDILIPEVKFQNRGFGTDAVRILTQYLFEELDVNKCWAEVNIQNQRAIRTLKKAGFTYFHTHEWGGATWHIMELYRSSYLAQEKAENRKQAV